MYHNLVSEIKKKLTPNKIVTQIAFQKDMTSKITICISIPLQTQEASPYLLPNLVSICSLGGEVIYRGNSLRVNPASLSE